MVGARALHGLEGDPRDRTSTAGGVRADERRHPAAIYMTGSLSSADQEFGGVGEGGCVDPSREHPGELPAAFLALDALYARDRPPLRFFFLDDDVRARLGGYLREVGDGKDLVALTELPQLRADRRSCLAAYPGVDL